MNNPRRSWKRTAPWVLAAVLAAAGFALGWWLSGADRCPICGMDLIPVPQDDADQDDAGELPRLRVGDSKAGGNAS